LSDGGVGRPSRATEPATGAKIAYIISAYRLPELLVRLVENLDGPGTCTLIHVDAKAPDYVFRYMTKALAARSRVTFLPRHPCHWGDFGHVRATLKGLSELISSGQEFDYVVLLTGQDYPLRSNEDLARTLGQANGQVFMRPMPIPNEEWTNGGNYRFENWHFRLAGRTFSFPGLPLRRGWLRAAWSRAARSLHLQRSFPVGLEPWGGSSYWMIPADCARYIDRYARSHPSFVKFFHHVRVPDEIFFHTIVMNSPFRSLIASSDLRYIDWTGGGDSPKVLTTGDIPRLMDSGALFARKFDPSVDAEVLDRIDRIRAGERYSPQTEPGAKELS